MAEQKGMETEKSAEKALLGLARKKWPKTEKRKRGGDLAAFFFFLQSREKVIVLRSTGLL